MHDLSPNFNKLIAYDGILARENGNEVPVMKDVTAVVGKQSNQKYETLKCSKNETISATTDKSGFLPSRPPSATKEFSRTRRTLRLRSTYAFSLFLAAGKS